VNPATNPADYIQTKTETKPNKKLVVPAKPSPPKNDLGKKEKDKDPEPFWDLLVKTWFDFNFEKFGEKPSFSDADPRYLKKIIEKLKSRAVAKKIEWNEVTGPERLKTFLDGAFKDEWLCKHFLLRNLNEQFDTIILKQRAASIKKIEPQKQKPQSVYEEALYLLGRYCEGKLNINQILEDHYEILVARGFITSDKRTIDPSLPMPVLEQKQKCVLQYFQFCKSKQNESATV
jgi:hypothetical protein